MNVISTVRSLFSRKKTDAVVVGAAGPYFDLHSLSQSLRKAITVLEEDGAELQKALYESGGFARVCYRSKFHNRKQWFNAPGMVRKAIADNDHALRIYREALNESQSEPHQDFATIIEHLHEAHRTAA